MGAVSRVPTPAIHLPAPVHRRRSRLGGGEGTRCGEEEGVAPMPYASGLRNGGKGGGKVLSLLAVRPSGLVSLWSPDALLSRETTTV